MRTVAEWREIYLRVRDWDGGEGNPVHRQCPVCLGRFMPKKADARFCSQSCRNLWNRARAIAGEADKPSNRQTVKPSNRYVELAVCEDCHRVFRPASMRGALCMSCAARRPDPFRPPAGFVKAVCPDCGNAFMKPYSANQATCCWKCADRRRKKAEWRRRRRLAERPVVFEDAVCEDCGKTFRRRAAGSRPGRPRPIAGNAPANARRGTTASTTRNAKRQARLDGF